MAPIEIPPDTLERLREMEDNKRKIQQRQSLIVQTLVDASDEGVDGGVEYDLQEGVIRAQDE